MGQNEWYHFGVDAPPILVYFSGWIGFRSLGIIFFEPWPFGLAKSREIPPIPGAPTDGDVSRLQPS